MDLSVDMQSIWIRTGSIRQECDAPGRHVLLLRTAKQQLPGENLPASHFAKAATGFHFGKTTIFYSLHDGLPSNSNTLMDPELTSLQYSWKRTRGAFERDCSLRKREKGCNSIFQTDISRHHLVGLHKQGEVDSMRSLG